MYELIQVGNNTYYINCPAKMGIFKLNDVDICLIDSGNDKNAANKVLKTIIAEGWNLKMIINTHSHADHLGGNNYFQQKTNCKIYTVGIERHFAQNPILEPSLLYGGYPCKALKNKFLYAQTSIVEELTEDVLPKGLEALAVDGHTMQMTAIKTSDDIWFLADTLTGEYILQKYHISFLYDVEKYLISLEKIKSLSGKLFIPAHAEPSENIQALIEINLNKTYEIINLLEKICQNPTSFEDILKYVFDHYGLNLDFNQYVLTGSTIRSYLSYLYDNNKLTVNFDDNKLLWHCQI